MPRSRRRIRSRLRHRRRDDREGARGAPYAARSGAAPEPRLARCPHAGGQCARLGRHACRGLADDEPAGRRRARAGVGAGVAGVAGCGARLAALGRGRAPHGRHPAPETAAAIDLADSASAALAGRRAPIRPRGGFRRTSRCGARAGPRRARHGRGRIGITLRKENGNAPTTGNSSDAYLRLYTPPVADLWRGVAATERQTASPPEGQSLRIRYGAGVQYRGADLRGDVMAWSSQGTLDKTGASARLACPRRSPSVRRRRRIFQRPRRCARCCTASRPAAPMHRPANGANRIGLGEGSAWTSATTTGASLWARRRAAAAGATAP